MYLFAKSLAVDMVAC